jgi:hypothetical protein
MSLAEANQSFVNIKAFDNLIYVLTQYGNIHDKVSHNSTLWKRKVKVTYLLHLRVVLVLKMVRSLPRHLKHQWSQISTFVSLNHIHHHTYFKSSYVHIQVFHILHHHTMKLLQAFESFMLGRLIVEIGNENWLAVGRIVRQQKLIRCKLCNSAVKTSSLLAPQFRQWMLIRCRQLSFGSESQIRCR